MERVACSLGTVHGEREEESSNGFPEQREPRFSHLRGPGVQLTSKRNELSSCQEVLEFWRWCWHAAARGLVSSDSGERDSISL